METSFENLLVCGKVDFSVLWAQIAGIRIQTVHLGSGCVSSVLRAAEEQAKAGIS